MAQADLHVHSTASNDPSELLMKRLGMKESYTRIEDVYVRAKRAGMTYVTLTDHNTIEGARALTELHPFDTFISVESTVTFPEDGCSVHVLSYGINERIFGEIEERRGNIYRLREYLVENKIACAVAHPLFPTNGRLTLNHLEKLLLLFNVFEGINAARPSIDNNLWMEATERLSEERINELSAKHRIKPVGETPWVKTFTGGSDDHAGLFIGTGHTIGAGDTIGDFLAAIADGKTAAGGRNMDYRRFAFTVLKLAWEFIKGAADAEVYAGKIPFLAASLIFDEARSGARNWLVLQQLKISKNEKTRLFRRFFETLLRDIRERDSLDGDRYLDRIYENIATLSDELLSASFSSIRNGASNGDIIATLKNGWLLGAGSALCIPFIATLGHFHENRRIHDAFARSLLGPLAINRFEKRVLWFADTVKKADYSSETAKSIARCACRENRPVRLVVSLKPEEMAEDMPDEFINLPPLCSFSFCSNEADSIRIPSLLRSLEKIWEYQPDEIIVSTSGPIGILGMAMAKLFAVPCTTVFHTDFAGKTGQLLGDATVTRLAQHYERLFHGFATRIKVPTRHSFRLLEKRGVERTRFELMPYVIDHDIFRFNQEDRWKIRKNLALEDCPVLLYTGLGAQSQPLDFLALIYKTVLPVRNDIHLIIAGVTGEQLKLFDDCPLVHKINGAAHADLAPWYSAADLLLCPNASEECGPLILQSAACGLPALTADHGGMREIVKNCETGLTLPENDLVSWKEAILYLVERMCNQPEKHLEMRFKAQKWADRYPTPSQTLQNLIGEKEMRYNLPLLDDEIPRELFAEQV